MLAYNAPVCQKTSEAPQWTTRKFWSLDDWSNSVLDLGGWFIARRLKIASYWARAEGHSKIT